MVNGQAVNYLQLPLISPNILPKTILFYVSGLVLNSFIRHYEPAYFSKEHLALQRATNVKAQLHKGQRRKRETHSQFYEKDHASSKDTYKSFSNDRYHKPIAFNFTAHNRLVCYFRQIFGCKKSLIFSSN